MRRVAIMVGKVLRARGAMLRNKTNGPADCLVTELLRCSPTEIVYKGSSLVRQASDSKVNAELPEAWKVLRLVFLKKPDAKLEKGLRGFRAIALLGVFSEWCTTVQVDMLHDEKEPNGRGCTWEPKGE